MSFPLSKLIVILGPTSSGKTDLGIKLAKKFNGEVISADSRQVYREFTIGTAKPEGHWARVGGRQVFLSSGIPHHLVDEVDPKEEFTLTDFKRRALEAIAQIKSRGKTPFLVGGTALYIYAVTENLEIPPVSPNAALRARLEGKPVETLFKELEKKDPAAAEITQKNKRRIIRALEVIEATGKKFSEQRGRGPKLFNILKLGIAVQKEVLEERLRKRIEQMLRVGLLDEIRHLANKYSWDIPPMQSIDYYEFKNHLAGKESLESAVKKTIHDHLELARHQATWFKRDKDIRWVETTPKAENLVEEFLTK